MTKKSNESVINSIKATGKSNIHFEIFGLLMLSFSNRLIEYRVQQFKFN